MYKYEHKWLKILSKKGQQHLCPPSFLSAQTKNANYPLDCSSRLTLFSAYLKNDTTTVGVDA